jgi:general secretion pathway protein B
MSFILDALKKSESERQRQSGPALFEVKVAPPRGRFAIWATGLGALLAVNLIVVGWMAMRGSAKRGSAAAQEPSAAALPAANHAVPTTSGAPTSNSATYPAAPPGSAPPARGLDNRYGAATVPPGAATLGPAQGGTTELPSGAPSSEDSHAAGDAGEPPAAADDIAPAVEPPHRTSLGGGEVIRQTESGLPTYQDAAAAPGANLPDLRLDLHVYAPQPDQRFVFINMMKLHEGDSLPIGVRVESITTDGVILSYHGTKFVLQH